jgi:hypothetical protein
VEKSWFFVLSAKPIWMWKKKKSMRAKLFPAPNAALTSRSSQPEGYVEEEEEVEAEDGDDA